MKLQEKLDKIAEASAKKIPEEMMKVMKAETQRVADSIPTRNIPKVGDELTPFELPDSQGNMLSSQALATVGPFVVSFFRGKW